MRGNELNDDKKLRAGVVIIDYPLGRGWARMCSRDFGFVHDGKSMEGRGRERWRVAGWR